MRPNQRNNSGKPWTDEQVRQLKELADQNTPIRIVALKLGRTTFAIRRRAEIEGLWLSAVAHQPYIRKTEKRASSSA